MKPETAFRPGGSAMPSALEKEREAVDVALSRILERLDAELERRAVPGEKPGEIPGEKLSESPGGGSGENPDRSLDVMRHGVLGGGKRIRPILCVAAFHACGGPEGAPIHDLAAALELVHAYSLMHDDLPCMDDAELRRGRPTTHRVHGEMETMVAGAALIPAAALQAWRGARGVGLDEGASRELVRVLMAAAGASGMVGGQALDLLGEGRKLDEPSLTRLHRLKTGALLAAAPGMGARAARAEPEAVAALERYGWEIGLGFQIADDLLDATGTTEQLGKKPSDRDLDKSTYVSLFGVEGAGRMAEECRTGAHDALAAAGIDAPLLEELADYVVRRSA